MASMMCSVTSFRVTLPAVSAAMALGLFLAGSPALAQSAIERHPPKRPDVPTSSVSIAEQDFGRASEAPLGVNLAGIHIIGQSDAVAAHPASGITGIAAVGEAGKTVDPTSIRAALSPFLGKPLSLALARDVQAAIARVYKTAGFPFVSVTLPPQEITSGVLQVRVIEFQLGTVAVNGEPAESAISSQLRAKPGEPIDAAQLEEDLSWLNRTPYRRAQGAFRPGEQTGLSNLDLTVRMERPWQVFAGWSNSGSKDTGRDRYFVGANAYLAALGGTVVSYQLTGSDTAFADPGRLVPQDGDYPDYLSHSARITIPTFARQELEIAPAFVASRQEPNPFIAFENRTFELPIIYRSAVSNLLPGHYWGEIYGGVEFKRLERTTYFAGIPVANGGADLFQLVLGWTRTVNDRLGRTAIDARVKADPGGVLGDNDAAAWSLFSNNRVDDVTYAYAALDISRITPLPAHLTWVSAFSGILSGQPLPDTERMSLGGRYAVRGYGYDDVSVDSGFTWRNELRLPAFALLGRFTGLSDRLSPYLFADAGYGVDKANDDSSTLASVGLGADYDIGKSVSTSLSAAYALTNVGATRSGDWAIQASFTARY